MDCLVTCGVLHTIVPFSFYMPQSECFRGVDMESLCRGSRKSSPSLSISLQPEMMNTASSIAAFVRSCCKRRWDHQYRLGKRIILVKTDNNSSLLASRNVHFKLPCRQTWRPNLSLIAIKPFRWQGKSISHRTTNCGWRVRRNASFLDLFDNRQRPFSRDLLQNLIQLDLISSTFAIGVDPCISNDDLPRLQVEAQDYGLDLEVSEEFSCSDVGYDAY